VGVFSLRGGGVGGGGGRARAASQKCVSAYGCFRLHTPDSK
jgi:hypothetical protein